MTRRRWGGEATKAQHTTKNVSQPKQRPSTPSSIEGESHSKHGVRFQNRAGETGRYACPLAAMPANKPKAELGWLCVCIAQCLTKTSGHGKNNTKDIWKNPFKTNTRRINALPLAWEFPLPKKTTPVKESNQSGSTWISLHKQHVLILMICPKLKAVGMSNMTSSVSLTPSIGCQKKFTVTLFAGCGRLAFPLVLASKNSQNPQPHTCTRAR